MTVLHKQRGPFTTDRGTCRRSRRRRGGGDISVYRVVVAFFIPGVVCCWWLCGSNAIGLREESPSSPRLRAPNHRPGRTTHTSKPTGTLSSSSSSLGVMFAAAAATPLHDPDARHPTTTTTRTVPRLHESLVEGPGNDQEEESESNGQTLGRDSETGTDRRRTCRCEIKVPTATNTTNTTTARICYLIVVHNEYTIERAWHLVQALQHANHIILIHVDWTVRHLLEDDSWDQPNPVAWVWDDLLGPRDKNPTSNNACCPYGRGTIHVDSVHRVEWGTWSMNLPTLWGLQVAVELYGGEWQVWMNLAGDAWPVYTPTTMGDLLQALSQYNFVTSRSCATGLVPTPVTAFASWWHKRQHYTDHEKRVQWAIDHETILEGGGENTTTSTITTPVTIYFGSQWLILQASFCQWFVTQYWQRPQSFARQLATALEDSGKLMTDETYWATLLMHVPQWRDTLPQTTSKAVSSSSRRTTQSRPPPSSNEEEEKEESYLLWNNGTRSHVTAVRFERMDEHVPALEAYTGKVRWWTHPRYSVSDEKPNQPTTTTTPQQPDGAPPTRPWGPYYVGVYDLHDLRASGALILRRVSPWVDDNLYRLLPVDHVHQIPDIAWPAHGHALDMVEPHRWSSSSSSTTTTTTTDSEESFTEESMTADFDPEPDGTDDYETEEDASSGDDDEEL